jgi:phenylalanyl-tRNA synthetase beta chain
MKISYSWLKEYLNTELLPEDMAKILTSLGLEVESLERVEAVKGGLKGVVVGEVLTCQKHPDADKLSITTVSVGQPVPLNIVCGAPNVAVGQKVAVATIGSVLYFGEQEVIIKKTKIRGQLSEGMICAEDELGLGTSHDGIMVLSSIATVGAPASEYFKLDDDYLFEIGLTPNRIDAASHIGVARDLAAYLNLKQPTAYLRPSVEKFKVDSTKLTIPVEVENPIACPRYSGVTISNINVGPSPDWLQRRLRSIGLNPINNVVDVTNFVLHEIGQPLHAFDADAIVGKKVVVKTLASDTPFVTLDGLERKLSPNDLMICNTEGGMCIAGVFGGNKSGVSDQTKNIFLESACFNPIWVRKTAKRFGLNTDASFRFERGTDPNITVWALKRAALLIKEVAGGEISSEISDFYPSPVADFQINLSLDYLRIIIGKEVPVETIKKILEGLEIKVISESANSIKVVVPPYRVDVKREADIAEEILRVYGYNNVEVSERATISINHTPRPDRNKVIELLSDTLSANGYSEIMCNSLTPSAYYERLESYPSAQLVRIINALSSDLNAMRQSLIFGGLETISYNINRRSHNLKLFEFGNCYSLIKTDNTASDVLAKYKEEYCLGIWLSGEDVMDNWLRKPQKISFYHLKGVVSLILDRMGISELMIETDEAPSDMFDYGLSLSVGGKNVGFMGLISDKLAKIVDLKAEAFFAELRWDMLFEFARKQKVQFTELPRYPEVSRDLALLLDKQVSFKQVREIALKTESKLIKGITLFDFYQGPKLGDNKKSYAVNFVLRDDTKTLTDKIIDKTMSSLMAAFVSELGAQIR